MTYILDNLGCTPSPTTHSLGHTEQLRNFLDLHFPICNKVTA